MVNNAHLDALRSRVSETENAVLLAGERIARTHDDLALLVAQRNRLDERIAQQRAILADLIEQEDDLELAHREASRDLELELDQIADGAYGDDMDDASYIEQARLWRPVGMTVDEADHEYMVGVFGPA